MYRTVLIMTTRKAEQQFAQLGAELTERSKTLYGATYENGTSPLDMYTIREAINGVEIFAALVNQSLASQSEDEAEPVCSGLRLHKALRNRTFDLTLGPTYVDESGSRQAELRIFAFNTSTQMMEVSYVSIKRQLLLPMLTHTAHGLAFCELRSHKPFLRMASRNWRFR